MVDEALPGEVAFALDWRVVRDGRLAGSLIATNIAQRRVRLAHKPRVTPLGVDGQPVDFIKAVTLEGKDSPFVELAPGEQTEARITWGASTGAPASGQVQIDWPGGRAVIAATGPRRPLRVAGDPGHVSSGWFGGY